MSNTSTAVIIREATPEDEPFLWEMVYERIQVEPGKAKPSRNILKLPSLARYAQGWGRPGDRGWIAEMAGKPLGVAWFRLFPATDKGYGFVAEDVPELSVSVVTEEQGKGLGARLLTHLVDQAKADGYRGLSLSVDNPDLAISLYQRRGFETVSTKENGSIVMFRPLFESVQ